MVCLFTFRQADLILHVGLNARLEATMLNVRIRQRWLRGGLTVGTIGAPVRLTYDHQNLGLTPASLLELAEGKVWCVCVCVCVMYNASCIIPCMPFE